MPTPDPSLNGYRRGSRGLRGTSGGAGRYTGAASTLSARVGLAVALLAIGAQGAGCAPQPARVDPEAREAAAQARIAHAREVASATLPEGAMEAARLGYVTEGIPASLAAPSLSNAFASIEDLAATVLDGIQHGRGQALWNLAITREEFRDVVYPVLPASRPERNTPMEYVWSDLRHKSSASLNATLAEHGGRHYELVRVDFVAPEQRQRDYGAFRVHRDARVVVEREDGSEVALDLFGSVIERNGRFKVFSYVTD